MYGKTHMLKYYAFVTYLCFGHISHAEGGPFRYLVDHYLIENLERDGDWDVTFLETRVVYECLKCAGSVKAEIEVFPVRGKENRADFHERYLYQRKLFCTNLVVKGNGRCLSTEARHMRVGALSGFRSSQIIENRREVETAFFSYDWDRQPIVMKATVSSDIEAESTFDILSTLEWHMRRLTMFW
ncbi:hypothetical protein N6L27_00675 [Leisingera sp. SS27]|uniref:hypothetical protein n=1 Tax=Leisingera sp. SS27 TaxID=2979462 RepID=UPI00232E4BF8|nr:hypothetical protein [Leisingera sp. SS27]MDC0656507.1 hypothetical protein [Leisingera sp. SS27]